jgi:hypothetical protein
MKGSEMDDGHTEWLEVFWESQIGQLMIKTDTRNGRDAKQQTYEQVWARLRKFYNALTELGVFSDGLEVEVED